MNKKIKILTTIFLVTLFIIGCKNTVKAASANISASNTSITQGDTITITTTINGASWDVNLSGAVSQGYADTTDDAENGNKSYTYSFTPTEAGTYTIKLSGNVSDSDETRSTVSDEITINVAQKVTNTTTNENQSSNTSNNESTENSTTATPTATTQTKSNNANLRNLGINPNDFTGFRPGITSYNVTVPNNVEEVTVYANLQDSKASLTGTGSKALNIGKNELKVVVTAEDGTKKTYTINVTREETSTEAEESIAENKSADLIDLKITGYEIKPKFSSEIYEYALDLNEDISELDVIAEGANNDISIEIVGNTDLVEGENIITVLVHNSKTDTNSTYQIAVNKTNINLESLNTALNDSANNANNMKYIIIGIILFIIIGIIIFIVARKKYKDKNLKNDIYEYDEEDREKFSNDQINLDEEEGLFKRVNRTIFERPEEQLQGEETINKSDFNMQNKANNDNIVDVVDVEEDEDDDDEKEEYFRASNIKRRGKHF